MERQAQHTTVRLLPRSPRGFKTTLFAFLRLIIPAETKHLLAARVTELDKRDGEGSIYCFSLSHIITRKIPICRPLYMVEHQDIKGGPFIHQQCSGCQLCDVNCMQKLQPVPGVSHEGIENMHLQGPGEANARVVVCCDCHRWLGGVALKEMCATALEDENCNVVTHLYLRKEYFGYFWEEERKR